MIARMVNPPEDVSGYDPVSTAGDCSWDPEAAQLALDFFPTFLQHVKGKIAGQPYHLNPWEEELVATLCGWKRPDGSRRYRECFTAVPRKNNKTTLCAGLALFFLLCDKEKGAEIYLAAADKEQASLAYNIASSMGKAHPDLADRLDIRDSYKRILYRQSLLKAIPADAAGSHGFNCHVAVLDELHTQPNRDLYDVLKSSQGARFSPLLISISTAGYDQETICWEVWDYARKVRDGVIDDAYFLPCIYEMQAGSQWDDPETWKACNPNLGRSINQDWLESECKRAKVTPSYENTFRRLYLNQWTESDTRWIPTASWEACEASEWPDLSGQACYAGLDLASTDDLTALVYVWPYQGKYYVKPYFWCPEETLRERPKKYHGQYLRWMERGLLKTTPGAETKYEYVRQQILEDAKQYRLQELLYDEYQARDTISQLSDVGICCTKVVQSYSGLWPGVKAVEEAVADKTLAHDGNEIMRWMLSCTVLSTDPNGNSKPDRKKSHGVHHNRGKIDGIVALVMAMIRATSSNFNIYDERGVLTL